MWPSPPPPKEAETASTNAALEEDVVDVVDDDLEPPMNKVPRVTTKTVGIHQYVVANTLRLVSSVSLFFAEDSLLIFMCQ